MASIDASVASLANMRDGGGGGIGPRTSRDIHSTNILRLETFGITGILDLNYLPWPFVAINMVLTASISRDFSASESDCSTALPPLAIISWSYASKICAIGPPVECTLTNAST